MRYVVATEMKAQSKRRNAALIALTYHFPMTNSIGDNNNLFGKNAWNNRLSLTRSHAESANEQTDLMARDMQYMWFAGYIYGRWLVVSPALHFITFISVRCVHLDNFCFHIKYHSHRYRCILDGRKVCVMYDVRTYVSYSHTHIWRLQLPDENKVPTNELFNVRMFCLMLIAAADHFTFDSPCLVASSFSHSHARVLSASLSLSLLSQ